MVEHVLLLMLVDVQMVGLVNIVLMVSRQLNCVIVITVCMILDVDECTSQVPCEQTCTNTQGSFQCSCGSGYTVNGSRCNGQC